MASAPHPQSDEKSPLRSSRSRLSARREKPLTDREYADRVKSYAQLSAGQHYRTLANFLFAPYQRNVGDAVPSATSPSKKYSERFLTMYILNESSPPQVHNVCDVAGFSKVASDSEDLNVLLFLRGHQPPEMLNAIGAKYRVDPEFFRQHLDLGSRVDQSGNSPFTCLPSTCGNIVRLPSITVASRSSGSGLSRFHHHNKLSKIREETAKRLEDHIHNIRQGRESQLPQGTSLVRDFAIHDYQHFSLDQEISVYVAGNGKRWIGIVWLDTGIDLSQDKSGPWQAKALQCESWEIQFSPIVQHQPGAALNRRDLIRSSTAPQLTSKIDWQEPSRLLQTSSLLHRNYGEHLDNETMNADPFYALTDIFAFVAAAEAHFLDTLQLSLDREIDIPLLSRYSSKTTTALWNLVYNKRLLSRHLRRLQDITSFISHQSKIADWPVASTPDKQIVAARAAERLRMDYTHLVDRCHALCEAFDNAMDILQNNTMIEESQRAIQQAEGLAKLTRLAFFFIPLSLTSSMFGMNVKQFVTEAPMSIWVWVVTSTVTLMFSYAVLSWGNWRLNEIMSRANEKRKRKRPVDVERPSVEMSTRPSSVAK
ncbi:hypothetical protein EJ04DRAFT_506027 [Polyplosphaeria fusca]|uniref:Uncharacterized protein n=1 Tax=Polyplosphaeria fusca TaxID=682080 RepID=A0A9P4QLT8_9PLEO|nr:hypothetical protein EJ04DRAFT_506027 [Polyplosphaeria fusca]